MARAVGLLLLVLRSVQSDFSTFAGSYDGQKSSPGFLVEYFSANRDTQRVAEAGCDCSQCPNLVCPCSVCPGLSANEGSFAGFSSGSPDDRGLVRVASRVTPALEFQFTQPPVGTPRLPEEDLGYFQDDLGTPSPYFTRTWAIRMSGIIKATTARNRIRVVVTGSCWSYVLRLNNGSSIMRSMPNVDPSIQHFEVPANVDTSFALDFRQLCDTSSVRTLSVRNIPQRWIGPSRVFLSSEALPGDATINKFDSSCQSQSPPSLGTWKALLSDGSPFTTRFPVNQLVFPLAHRIGTRMIVVGNLSMRAPSDAAERIAYDSYGDYVRSSLGVWVMNGSNCGNWASNVGSGSQIAFASSSYDNWIQSQGVTAPCSSVGLFYCVEVFPATATTECALDVISNKQCTSGNMCRVDGDCNSTACTFGQCSGLNSFWSYCLAGSCPTGFCPTNFVCQWFASDQNKSCVNPDISSGCANASYTWGMFRTPFAGPPPPNLNLCPAGYKTLYSPTNGSFCNSSGVDMSCCGPFMPCATDCPFITNPDGHLVAKPYHTVLPPFAFNVTMMNFDLDLCFNTCKMQVSNLGSFAYSAGQCVCSASQVVRSSTLGHAWIVIPNSDQEFAPFTDLAVYHTLPQHNISTSAMQSFYQGLSAARTLFVPTSSFSFSDFFCLITGIQCINGAGNLIMPGEIATEFNFFLPLWGLSHTQAIPLPSGLRHLDLSMNPNLAPILDAPSSSNVSTIGLLGMKSANCAFSSVTSYPALTRIAATDRGCSGMFSASWRFPALQYLVLHETSSPVVSVSIPTLQALMLLNGSFIGINSAISGGTASGSLYDSPVLSTFVSIGADFDMQALWPSNKTLRYVEIRGIGNQDTVNKSMSLITASDLYTLTLAGTDDTPWTQAINFSNVSALRNLSSLQVTKATEPQITLASGALPSLSTLSITEITRSTPKPLVQLLDSLACCESRSSLRSVDLSGGGLTGPIPGNRWILANLNSLNLARNFLTPTIAPRTFPITSQSTLDGYLRNWTMSPILNLGFANLDLSRNPILRGYGNEAMCQMESSGCAFPGTGFCSNTSNVCTPFWLLEAWITSRSTTPASPPLPSSPQPTIFAGPVRVFTLIYSFAPIASGAGQCGWAPFDGTGTVTTSSLSTKVFATNLYLGQCDFNVGSDTGATLGRFGVGTPDSITRWVMTTPLSPNFDASNSSNMIMSINASACVAGSCRTTGACGVCRAGTRSTDGCTNCDPCPNGTVSPDYASNCTQCPDGFEASGGSSCVACLPGFFSVNGSSCQACDVGRAAPLPNSTSCTNCTAGKYQPGTKPVCSDCPLGQFNNMSGLSSCTFCPVGSFQGTTGSTVCGTCGNGTEALNPGQRACDPCKPGTYYYSPSSASTGCVQCGPGQQQNRSGQTSCDACPSGTASNDNGTVTCRGCELGSYNWEAGKTSCVACSIGYYQNVTGQTNCTQCEPGFYSVMPGQPSCAPCPTGSIAPLAGSTVCQQCPNTTHQSFPGRANCENCTPGRFAQNEGQVDCDQCSPGRFADKNGSFTCQMCEVGFFANLTGVSSCTECLAGRDSTTTGLSICTDCVPGRAGLHCHACEAGKYQAQPGQPSCLMCPDGQYSDDPLTTNGNPTGAKFCLDCPAGKFGEFPRGNSSTCVPCAANSTSLAGAAGPGNCSCLVNTYGDLENGTGPVCRPCPNCAVCPGGTRPHSPAGCFVSQVAGSTLYEAAVCSPLEACAGDSVCAPEYQGLVCSQCRTNHYRVNGKCLECPNYAGVFWFLMVILLFIITLGLLRLSRPNLSKITSVSIFLSGVQIISVFGYLPVPYPDGTVQMFKALSIANFNLDLFSPECSTKMRFYGLWLFKLALPLFFAISLGMVYFSLKLVPRCRPWFYRLMGDVDPKLRGKMARGSDTLPTPSVTDSSVHSEIHSFAEEVIQGYVPSDIDRFVYCIVSLMTLLYTFLSSTAAQPFACVLVGSSYVLARDVSESCYTSEWTGYAVLGGIMLVVYMLGIPAVLFYFLFRGNQQNKVYEAEFLSRFGSLVVAFRSQFYFWEIVDMTRKAGVVLCITFLPSASDADKTLQINLIFLLTFAFLLAQVMTNPFEYNFCNRLCFVWLTVTLLTLVSALLFQSSGLGETDINAYSVFLLVLVLAAVAATLYVGYREIRRAHWRFTMEKRTGVSTMNRRKMQRALLGQIFEGFSHDVWRKMRIYNDEESLKFFHYLAQEREEEDEQDTDRSGGLVRRLTAKSMDKNVMSPEDIQESEKVAHTGALDLVRGPNFMA